jgi:hypothetical protein
LQHLLTKGLEATMHLWPALQVAYRWVWRAAHALGEHGPDSVAARRRQLGGLLGGMVRQRAAVGYLGAAISHFIKVTRSYWSGLFHCYDVDGLPRTNNDLEHLFGSHRYHERRASGRKGAAPALVLRGEARLLAAVATRQRRYSALELASADPERREQLKQRLEKRRRRRAQRHRFRKGPQKYLRQLEEQLLKSALPS